MLAALIQIFRWGISRSLSLCKAMFVIGRRQKATPALMTLFYVDFTFKAIKQSRSPCWPAVAGAVMSFALLPLPHGFSLPVYGRMPFGTLRSYRQYRNHSQSYCGPVGPGRV